MKKLTLTFAVLCTIFLALAATASAGLKEVIAPVAPAPSCEPFDWTGFYIGGNIGADWGRYEFGKFDEESSFDLFLATRTLGDIDEGTQEFSDTFTGPFSPGQNAGSDSTFLGGGQIGFQKQWGHFVLGVEGDFDRTATSRETSFERSAQSSFTFEDDELNFPQDEFESQVLVNTDLTAIRKAQANWMASARLRAGYACGRCLLYVTGGVAFADVSAWAIDTTKTTASVREELVTDVAGSDGEVDLTTAESFTAGPFTDTNVSRDSKVLVGWTVGGGGEYAMNDCVSVGLEYRHSDFGDHTFHFDSNGGSIFPGKTSVSLDDDQVTFRVNFRFGRFFAH